MAVLDTTTEQSEEEREAAALEHQRARGDFLDDEGGAPAGATGTTGADGAAAGATGVDADALAAVAGDDDDSDRQVPYPRFREVNDKLTAEREARARLEGENAALKAGATPAAQKEDAPPDMLTVDVKATRKAANAAMLEGDSDKADELAALADDALMAQSEERAVKRIQKQHADDAQAAEQAALNRAAVDVVKVYPELDSNSPKANKEAIEDVLALRNTYMAKGKNGADALREAADKVAKMHGYAKPAADDKGAAAATEEARRRREREAAQRGASASQHQPPPPAGRGDRGNTVLDPDTIDVAKLSDKDFKSLSDAEKSRLRGDVLP